MTELDCPGYVIDDAQRIIHLDGGEQAQFVFTNSKLPSLHLYKESSDGKPLGGVTYRLAKIEDGSRYLDRTSSGTGEICWEGLEPGVYSLIETSTVSDHLLDPTEYHVQLFPGKDATICLQNDKRPNLTIWKFDADDHSIPIPNTTFLLEAADGHSVAEVTTGPDGSVTVPNLWPGVFKISERSVGNDAYLVDAPDQYITLYPNRDREAYFYDHKRPVIEIIKENSITHDRLPNVRFQVWYASNDSRFFKLYIATAIAPVPLASFAGQPSSSIGMAFVKSYAAICLEGCVIVLACVIFSAFASTPPAIVDSTLAPATIVWNYVGELVFNMLVLVGAIKMSDRLIRELMGLG